MPSGPGGKEEEVLLRASLISLDERGSAEASIDKPSYESTGSCRGKICSRRALLMATGSETQGREGNLAVFLGRRNCFAVQMS